MSGIYSGKLRDFLKEIRSKHCFSSSKSERPFYCCETSILKKVSYIIFMSVFRNYLINVGSGMIRKGFQPIKK